VQLGIDLYLLLNLYSYNVLRRTRYQWIDRLLPSRADAVHGAGIMDFQLTCIDIRGRHVGGIIIPPAIIGCQRCGPGNRLSGRIRMRGPYVRTTYEFVNACRITNFNVRRYVPTYVEICVYQGVNVCTRPALAPFSSTWLLSPVPIHAARRCQAISTTCPLICSPPVASSARQERGNSKHQTRARPWAHPFPSLLLQPCSLACIYPRHGILHDSRVFNQYLILTPHPNSPPAARSPATTD
jgi:hypothetical protein